ncbi:putative oxidoreductase [Rhizomicrobium palustre]|uniref:Putative oxidoreductase n=1 Tax=Rhizomicrobium palustre TaxID=189966 RepID=A0A846MUL8_9PROT|nr:aldo/keto reductase [Rhizomicrobium palustre]NIK87198.1 putative oxidoreductase [Rhizomicrobium palustre]
MIALTERGKKRLAYGFWRYHEGQVEEALAMVSAAREAGIDHLDTADVYGGVSGYGGAERLLGTLRKQAPKLFDGAFIATKGGIDVKSPYCSSQAYLQECVDGSLSRLGVARIDLFYIHRPDILTHPAELAATLDGFVAAGKIAAVGASNFTVGQVDALKRYLKAPLVAHQLQLSPGHIEPIFDGTLDQAMRENIAIAAWSPLAGGRLGADGPVELQAVRQVLVRIAAHHGVAPSAIAMAFLLKHPACITPIIGTQKPQRLTEMLAGLTVQLSSREWYDIIEAARGHRMP